DFSGITNNVITSQGEIELFPGANVTPSSGNHSPEDYYEGAWPTAKDLIDWYGEDVEDATHYDSDTTINLYGVDQELGPLRVNGELTIKNSIDTDPPPTLTLTGTIYITGDTLIGTTDKDFTLDLKGYTIFVASNSSNPQKALEIGGKCKIIGPGAIIAIGDVYFQPNIPVGMTDPIFVMSASGKTLLQPGGNFYGSVAGSVEVDLKPGTSLNYPQQGYGLLNFPGCTAGRYIYGIATWEVSQQ
ncbi:pilus assembly protein PilZ, partial [Candidatus Bathyarchaeota archaeon]|nr:pilus assembly protein PilZ [Candidatus Bathyarchaeota archaeon]